MKPSNTTIFGWEVSPYTAKTRSYLAYKGIEFKQKVPSAFTLKGKIKKDVGQMIMPVVYHNDMALQDSSVIMDFFEQSVPQKSIIPNNSSQKILSLILEMFADEWLPMAALHYRWNYPENRSFILREFGKSALPYWPSFFQVKLAKSFAQKMYGYLPIMGISKDMQPALEKNTLNILNALNEHLGSNKKTNENPFIFGSQPSFADFALFGPIYAHLHRDPFPNNLVAQYAHVLKWINTLLEQPQNIEGQWSSHESNIDSLMPLLQIWASHHAPLIRHTISSIGQWMKEHPEAEKLPRSIGKVDINIEGQSEKRLNFTYGYWMWQRIRKQYQDLTEQEQQPLNEILKSLKVMDLFDQAMPCQVELKRCRLYIINQ